MGKKRVQVKVLLSTFVKVLHWMCSLIFFLHYRFVTFLNVLLYDFYVTRELGCITL